LQNIIVIVHSLKENRQRFKMLTLLKNIGCRCPPIGEPTSSGEKDILIAHSKILKITLPGRLCNNSLIENSIDCRGLYAFPGFVDQHVHITGAGGEEGFHSRTRALEAPELFEAGITTFVGLLGADGSTRSMENLYAKAKALEADGLTSFIYSGSYTIPTVTLTGSLLRDIVYIDPVIGAGELAISDHRSSNPDAKDLVRLASDVHLGGLIAGKAGVVHLHVGDGKGGLSPLKDALAQSDLPPDMFVPTHLNRNPKLFRQAADYCKNGGRIDLTAGEKDGLSVPDAIRAILSEGIELSRVTVSSDAGGSIPSGGSARPSALYADFTEIIKQSVLPPGEAIRLFSENPARTLGLYPKKGTLREGSDADILIIDKEYRIKMLFCKGLKVMERMGYMTD
jgi:beta-aspartyl-dipeptidase (metallo-type)